MIDKIMYIYGFKIGDDESTSQDCLVSMNDCSMLDTVKYIKYSEHKQQLAKKDEIIEKLKVTNKLLYVGCDLHDFITKCGEYKGKE